MRIVAVVGLGILFAVAACAVEFTFEEQPGALVLLGDGTPWLSTHTAPFDLAHREETYKVYTDVYDFVGSAPITKGPGGKYTHHRGLFIGWRDTRVGDQHYDTWHMKECYQQHEAWLETKGGADQASQCEKVRWCTLEGESFIEEVRTIVAAPGKNGTRVIDFGSTLTSRSGTIPLRGDLQHAGMQIRVANEVVDHQDTTQYILPDGAEERAGDEVVGAWWVCGSVVVREKRYWIIHMTPRDHLIGQPVYSIRRYERFGAFFEPDLEEGKPLALAFRVVVSEEELNKEMCAALYEDYVR